MSKEKYRNRKYSIEPYNPEWAGQYNKEVQKLKKCLGDKSVSIHHIGSTSVPGLAGKPTIDILTIVENIEEVVDYVSDLKLLGYKYLGEYVMEGSRLFVKEKNNIRLVNLHFFHTGHKHIAEMIELRNYLRSHPESVKKYSKLKFELAKKYSDDYGSYREYKDEWLNALKSRIAIKD